MKFWKLHGIGNDFIAIDDRFNKREKGYYSDIAKKVCNRRFSVGADGFLIVKESDVVDIKMVYYNSDGSRAFMCGNGLRCFVRFVYENKIVEKEEFDVETLDGVKHVKINLKNGIIDTIKVNMGSGSFLTKDIPVKFDKEVFLNEHIKILDKAYKLNCMLMGVPHAVILVEDLDINEVITYGAKIEKNEIFPSGINVNFVKIDDRNHISVRTWERGCGYTLGCGTGMTASAIICNKLGLIENEVVVSSEGGSVVIDIDESIYMIGSAVKICEGVIE